MSSETSQTLSTKEKIGYGLGDTASNFVFHIVNAFLITYYTDVIGLNPAAVGTLYAVARLWDAISDPLMGGARRSDTDQIWKVSSLSFVDRCSLWINWFSGLPWTRLGPHLEIGVCLRNIHCADDGLYSN